MSDGAVERIEVSRAHGSGPEGANSAWVLPDTGIVIDPGPPDDAAWRRLADGLAESGLPVAEVTDVLITHWHVDHAGNAPRLATAADATVAMHEDDAPFVREYAVERDRRVERDTQTLGRWGVPESRSRPLIDADTPSGMPDRTPVQSLTHGDTVGPLRVLHTPGHTAGHAAFLHVDSSEDRGRSGTTRGLVGDALLRTITPNVGGGDTRQSRPLAAYRETLDRLESTVELALPGHGSSFSLAPRATELREHHRERAEAVLESLTDLDGAGIEDDAGIGDEDDPLPISNTVGDDDPTDGGGVTPWEIAVDRFGDMQGYHVKFGAGEAYAHLEDLVELGLATRRGDVPLEYRLADGPADGSSAGTVLDATWLESAR